MHGNIIQIFSIILILLAVFAMIKYKFLPFGMVVTAVGDIDYQSEAFKDTLTAIVTDTLAIKSSGVMAPIPEPIFKGNKKGDFVNMPMWKSFIGTMTPITSGGSLDTNILGTYKDRGVWISREYAVATEDIVGTITGSNPLDEVAQKIALFVSRNLLSVAVNTLKGVFGAAAMAGHTTGATYSGSNIDPVNVNAAKFLLGDNMTMLNRAIMHSKIQQDISNLLINSYGTFNRTEVKDGGNASPFMGLEPFVDDTLVPVASVYSTYISEGGTIGYSFRDFERTDAAGNKVTGNGIDIEIVRDALTSGGISKFIIRFYGIVHVLGTKWNVSTINPSNAQLATGTNWTTSVDDMKKIRIVELKTR